MKKIILALSVVTLLFFASCKNNKSYRSPSITFGKILVNNEELKDNTVYEGDSIKFYMVLEAYLSSLTNFNVLTNRSFLKDSVMSNADFEKFCNVAASNRSQGQYVFKALGEGTSLVLNPLYIIAKKSPNSDDKLVELQFQIKNDSPLDGEYNPITYTLRFKLLEKEAKKDEEEKQ